MTKCCTPFSICFPIKSAGSSVYRFLLQASQENCESVMCGRTSQTPCREKGRVLRAASTCGKHYLRPAAVAAGVVDEDDRARFGWQNLRHSLATFFGSNEVPLSTIQSMLRHAKPQTTARYIHAVISEQVEGQRKFLDAIKLGAKRSNRAA